MLRPDVAGFLAELRATPAIVPPDLAAARAQARALTGQNDCGRGDAMSTDITIEGPSDGRPLGLRIYRRPDEVAADAPVLLFLHGGGWTVCDLETHDGLCAEIARRLAMTVVAVDYRLAPENKFPAAVEDGLAAYDWLERSPDVIGHRVAGVVLAGDSSGGNLAAACAAARAAGHPPLALWLIYASLDMEAKGGSLEAFAEGHLLTADMMAQFRENYFESPEQRTDPRASPYHHPEFGKLPPSLVLACECDPLRDQSRAFGAKLARHGIPVRYREAKGQIHGCLTLRRRLPSAQDDLTASIEDLRSLIEESRRNREREKQNEGEADVRQF